jgi:DNA-binding CsgD family transcriptional regulator
VLILNHSTHDVNFDGALRKIKKIDERISLVELTDLPIEKQSNVNNSKSETHSLPNTIAPETLKKMLYALPVKPKKCSESLDIYHLKKRISEREMVFLFFLCSEEEYTYEQIADKMKIHVRTVDGFRKSLFQKLSIKSKTGLVMLAIRNNWV